MISLAYNEIGAAIFISHIESPLTNPPQSLHKASNLTPTCTSLTFPPIPSHPSPSSPFLLPQPLYKTSLSNREVLDNSESSASPNRGLYSEREQLNCSKVDLPAQDHYDLNPDSSKGVSKGGNSNESPPPMLKAGKASSSFGVGIQPSIGNKNIRKLHSDTRMPFQQFSSKKKNTKLPSFKPKTRVYKMIKRPKFGARKRGSNSFKAEKDMGN